MKKRHGGGGGRSEGSVMERKESKSESHEMARGDAVGQSGPFVCVCVCVCVATVNRCQALSSLAA